MISSVQNVNTVERSPFNDFSQRGNYYLTKEIAKDIYDIKEVEEQKKGKKIGLIVAMSSVIATVCVLAVTRGLPKNAYAHVRNLTKHLEESVTRRKLDGKSGPITTMMKFSANKLSKWSERVESINNFNAYKDMLFKNLMFRTKITRKIHQGITSFFERLTRGTVHRTYGASEKRFSKLFELFTNTNKKVSTKHPGRMVTINGVTKQASDWIQEAANRQARVQNELQSQFGKTARESRYRHMKTANIDLDTRVWKESLNGMLDAKGMKGKVDRLKDSQIHKSFIAEDLLAVDKKSIIDTMNKSRRIITHDIADNYIDSEKLLDGLQKLVNPQDAETGRLIKILRTKLSSYKRLSGSHEEQYREVMVSEIFEIMNSITNRVKKSASMFNYSDEALLQIATSGSKLKNILQKSEKGELQEILTIYKALLPREEYIKLRTSTNKTVKAFDKAINTENNLFFDKLRDLALGSAPTDVLSLLGSVAGVGVGLSMADTKEERKSAMLNYGIPIIGSLATSVVLTFGLVSGIKSMLIGLGSGAVMNRIGAALDKRRKAYNKEIEDNKHAENVKAEIQLQNDNVAKSA